jgi:hypothetical protein
MRRAITWILAVIVVALLAGTIVLYRNDRQRQSELATTQQQQQDLQGRYDRTIGAIGEIQDSLNAIEAGEHRVQIESRGLAAERRPQSRDVLESIAMLRSSIARNKTRIAELESSLRKSGSRTAGLRKLVDQLRRNVAEREQTVAVLTSQVDSLRTQVTGLTATVAEREDTLRVRDLSLEDRRRDLATVYYVVGDKKALVQDGVITAQGGIFGLGKTLLPTGRIDSPAFNAIDTDQQTVISTDANKVDRVKVLTPQPPESYQLVNVDGHVELHITDPLAFRRVKQLVILTRT